MTRCLRGLAVFVGVWVGLYVLGVLCVALMIAIFETAFAIMALM